MAFTTVSMNTWLYPDSKVESEQHTIKLNAVRGGSAGFQILCTDLKAGRLNVTATAPDGARSALWKFIASCPCAWKRTPAPRALLPIGKSRRSIRRAKHLSAYTTRWSLCLKADWIYLDGTQAVYVALTVARDCVPGKYAGKVCVEAGGQSMTVEYELCAAEAELPAESLNVTLWYSVGSMAAAHGRGKVVGSALEA